MVADPLDRPAERRQDEGPAFTARLAAGDAAAFEVLFARYFNRLRRYVYGYTRSWTETEDVVHDVFLRLWRRRRWLSEVRDLDAYVYRVTRNLALNVMRRRGVEKRWRGGATVARAAAAEEQRTQPPVAEERLASSERVATILYALDALPPRQREIILLRWRDGRSQEEIAALLEISQKTVEVHITRAYKRLRELLADV